MAFRSTGSWKNIANRLRAAYTTVTTPKSKAYAPAVDDFHHVDNQASKLPPPKGDFVPVYVSLGMITLSVGLGLYTAVQHLFNNPAVRVRKKMRETLPELEEPEKVMDEANRFLNKSLFRKVAHVQEFEHAMPVVPESIGKDVYAHKQRVETLKDVGVDPKISASR